MEKAVTYKTPETNPPEPGTTPPVVTVENGALTDGSENWDAENTAGVRFDEASGSVVMVNNANAVTIQTDSKGVNLSVAGVNRISTLYADGNVNITGTGIVLIDSIDMLEGTNLNLLTNTNIYTEGSAAVFLLNPETGSYELINGSVSGILDEEYTIPEGVTLVVPEGGTLDMRVTTTVTTTTDGTQTETHYGFTDEEKSILESDSEEEKKIFTEGVQQEGVLVQKSVIFSTPKLNIAAESCLYIQQGGQMLMNSFRNETLGVSNGSTLEVSGMLYLDGNISAYQGSGMGQAENFYLNVKDGGCVAGEGTLSGVTAVYETGAGDEDTLNIAGDGSYVKINNGGIAELNTSGNTGVVFDDGASIGSITAAEGGSVTFYATDYTAQMQADSITGEYDISSGYVTVGKGIAKENISAPTTADSISFLSNGGVMGQRETSVAHLEFWKDMGTLGQGSSFWKSGTLTGFGTAIDYSFLSGNSTTRGFDFYEVFVQEGDTLKLYLLNKDSTQSLSVENICQIRGVNFNSRIAVGEEVLNGSSNSGWTSSGSTGSGWRYDGASVSMVNNGAAVDIKAEGKGVDFSVAGLNRIGTLYADGDVNITGTGIVLIDKIDMKLDANLNLLSIQGVYENGSAAVFLKNENGEYVLINGSVAGILDEEYTIPSGITLVVPDDGKLDMRVTRTDTGSGTYSYSAPKLTVSSGAALEVAGQMKMNAFRVGTVINSSTLQIGGALRLNGTLSVYRNAGETAENFCLNVMSGGSVTGNGTMTGVTAIYETGAGKSDTLNITGDGSYVKINNGGIANLSTTGNTGVVFGNGASIGSAAATGSGRLTFYGVNFTDQMQANALSGSYSIGSGYVKVGTGFAGESFSAPAQSIPFLSNGGVMGQKETSVAHLEFWKDMGTLGQGSSFWKSGTLTGFGSAIDYSFLSGNSTTRGFDFYEVFVQEGDTLKLYLLNRDSTQSLSVENICQIRGVNFNSGITVGGTVLNGATNAGWTSGTGWRYDGTSVSMVNNGAAVDVRADGKGVDFSVAGLNRIGTLYADSDVNITGTGIVLIDSLDLKEGAKLNLLNIKDVYDSGSAAVFLKTGDGEYTLINKNVAGILDEKYTIPSGITLIVPDKGVLDMRVTTSVTTTTAVEKNGTTTTQTETHYGITQYDKDNIAAFTRPQETNSEENGIVTKTTVSKSIGFTVPELNISSNAVLRIQSGAQLLMQAFQDCITNFNRSSTLNVFGDLELYGEIEATGDTQNGNDANLRVNVKSGGSVTGTGTITDATIRYETGAGNGDQLNIAGGGNIIDLNSSGIGTLNLNGKADLYYADNVTMGSVSVAAAEGSDNGITFYGKNVLNRLNITNPIAGSYTISSGYLTVAGNYANEVIKPPTEGISIATKVCLPDVTGGRLYTKLGQYDTIYYCTDTNTANYSNGWESRDLYSESTISWSKLTEKLGNYSAFEVFTRNNGKVTVCLFSQSTEQTMSTSGVFLIRGFNLAIQTSSESGSGSINSGTSNTGSGVLGGENAGSLTGGNASGILNGDRTNPSEGQNNNTLTGTNTGSTGSGILGGGSSLTGGNASGILDGDRDSQSGGQNNNILTGTNTGSTGSGVLGGGSSLVGGNAVGVLGGTRKPPAPPQQVYQPAAPRQEASEYDLVLKVTGSGTEYDLKAFYDGVELKELGGGTVAVELEAQLDPGWNPNHIFAVFRDAQGKLVVVRVRCNALTGKLEFDAPMLGQFQLVWLDWEGTDYTDEAFLAAIAACLN